MMMFHLLFSPGGIALIHSNHGWWMCPSSPQKKKSSRKSFDCARVELFRTGVKPTAMAAIFPSNFHITHFRFGELRADRDGTIRVRVHGKVTAPLWLAGEKFEKREVFV